MNNKNEMWKIKVGLKLLFINFFKSASFISNDIYVKITYLIIFFKWPDTINPVTFNENIIKLKLSDAGLNYTKYTDKILVREYVKFKIGGKYLNEIYSVFNSFSQINFDLLPQKFVIKTNHGSGYNYIYNHSKHNNFIRLNNYFSGALKKNYYFEGKELNYKYIVPKIIVEKLLEPEEGRLYEFKVFCFKGFVKFFQLNLYFKGKRFSNIYYQNKELVNVIYGYPNFHLETLPNKTEEILKLAEKLSETFDFVRVDLYEVNNAIVFSELTFHPGGGLIPFRPSKFDKDFGHFFTNS